MTETKNLIKDLVLSKIKDEEKSVGSISSYSMNRNASGVWSIIIFWRGKTKLKSKRQIHIELDRKPEIVKLAIDTMEELLREDAENTDFVDRMKRQKEEIERKKNGPVKSSGW